MSCCPDLSFNGCDLPVSALVHTIGPVLQRRAASIHPAALLHTHTLPIGEIIKQQRSQVLFVRINRIISENILLLWICCLKAYEFVYWLSFSLSRRKIPTFRLGKLEKQHRNRRRRLRQREWKFGGDWFFHAREQTGATHKQAAAGHRLSTYWLSLLITQSFAMRDL